MDTKEDVVPDMFLRVRRRSTGQIDHTSNARLGELLVCGSMTYGLIIHIRSGCVTPACHWL